MMFTFLENTLNLGIFALGFCNLFLPTAERDDENYDLFYQNSIRKYEHGKKH